MMQKLTGWFEILIICMVVGASVSCDDYLSGFDQIVADELDRFSVQPTDDVEISQVKLPADLDAGANYGLKAIICSEGGYDLYAYAGQTVTMTSVEIEGSCSDLPIKIWVISTEDAVACAYFAVADDTPVAPGIWAVSDSSCTYETQENERDICKLHLLKHRKHEKHFTSRP